MNMKYRSVLAVGMSVALMLQAPVVAFATDAGSRPESSDQSAAGQGEQTPTTDSAVVVDQGEQTPTATGTVVVTKTSDNSTNTSDDTKFSGSGNTYIVTDDIQVPATTGESNTNTALVINGNSKNNSIRVVDFDQTISARTDVDEVGRTTYGNAVVTTGNANFTAGPEATIEGNLVNNGSGTIVSYDDVNGAYIGQNATGEVNVLNNVGGEVMNSGTSTVTKTVNNPDTSFDESLISDITGAVVYVEGNVTRVNSGTNKGVIIIDGTLSELVEKVDDHLSYAAGRENLYVHKVENSGNFYYKATGVNYIIKNTEGISSIRLGAKEGEEYTEKGDITQIRYKGQYRNYAQADSWIAFTVNDGYTLKNVDAVSMGNGRYFLQVPEGGGVYLTAEYIRAIQEAISEETGAPAVIVEQNTPVDVPVEVASNDGIQIISTAAGSALPTTELGNAEAATRSVSFDISKVTPAQFRDAVKDTVLTVPAGGVAVIETNEVATLDKNMIAAMSSRPDVAYNIVFKYSGLKMRVVIPAGYDVKSLLDEKGYCGFLRLAQILGFTILE